MEQAKQSKKVDIKPMKLAPPPAAARRLMENDKKRTDGNKVISFIKTFFGEGF